MLPHHGFSLSKPMKRYVTKLLPEHAKLEITFTGKNLNSCFSIKDKTSFEHVNCTETSCCYNYVGETGRRILERIKKIIAAEIMLHIW